MPRICELYGIVIFMYYGDHPPSHFHAREWLEQHRDELHAVNPESRTVEWPGEVDLDSEVLYGLHESASGHRIERRTVREPAAPS